MGFGADQQNIWKGNVRNEIIKEKWVRSHP
jgi:hypothetical protein